MDKRALVIINAWKDIPAYDIEKYGNDIIEDTRVFSIFLNRVCEKERKNNTTDTNTTIIHYCRQKLSDEIKIFPEDLIISTSIQDGIETFNKFDSLYFCGYHFGACIHTNVARAYKAGYNGKLGIVINLSMILPDIHWMHYKDNNICHFNWRYYMWTPVVLAPVLSFQEIFFQGVFDTYKPDDDRIAKVEELYF